MRFYYYKKFSNATTIKEIEDIQSELEDICGKLNNTTKEYIYFQKLRLLCQEKKVYKISRENNYIVLKRFTGNDVFLPLQNFQKPSKIYNFLLKTI
jgi:transcription-repair coupling factor (superfamily II helicase)